MLTDLPVGTVSGHYRPSSETPFKWRFAGGPMVAHSYMFTGLPMRSNFTIIDKMNIASSFLKAAYSVTMNIFRKNLFSF